MINFDRIDRQELVREFEQIINAKSIDSQINMPDYVIAEYLVAQLEVLRVAVDRTAKYKGE